MAISPRATEISKTDAGEVGGAITPVIVDSSNES